MPDSGRELLSEYVRRHNAGIVGADFTLLLELFHRDAVLIFDGAVTLNFTGKAAIAKAFSDMPPDEPIDAAVTGDRAGITQATYRTAGDPRSAGTISLTVADGKIRTMTITVSG